jgi:membrane fusion protein (multidrug efflux system)
MRSQVSCLALTGVLLLCGSAAWAQQPSPVTTAPVEKRPITVAARLVATTEPVMRTTVAAEQAALVQERMFDEGQAIEKGAILARFDDSLLQRRLASAEASARSERAELERARLVEENLRRERERLMRLYEQGAANEKEYLDAMNDHDRAQAAITVVEARVAEREAAADELRLQVEKMKVAAPFAGVVNRRYVEVGQWVQQGDAVAEIVQLDPLYVRTGVPEAVLPRLKVGDSARVTVDALGGRELEATISEILPVADAESRTFSVRLRVDNPGHELLPGMFARVTFSQQDDSWLVVPKDAIVRVRGQAMVVLAMQGMAKLVPVNLGVGDETSQAVRGEGLKEGDAVITRGNEGLMDGMPVMVQPAGGRPGGGGPPGAGGPPQDGGRPPQAGGGPGGQGLAEQPATRPAGQ